MYGERCDVASTTKPTLLTHWPLRWRDRFQDPRETAVKSDVKIKTRFTPPRDPCRKVERPRDGRGRTWDLHVCPVIEGGMRGGRHEGERERKYADKKKGKERDRVGKRGGGSGGGE